jgi:hypothetical protein
MQNYQGTSEVMDSRRPAFDSSSASRSGKMDNSLLTPPQAAEVPLEHAFPAAYRSMLKKSLKPFVSEYLNIWARGFVIHVPEGSPILSAKPSNL